MEAIVCYKRLSERLSAMSKCLLEKRLSARIDWCEVHTVKFCTLVASSQEDAEKATFY